MEREKAIELAKVVAETTRQLGGTRGAEAVETLIKIIEVGTLGGWVAVSERLPEGMDWFVVKVRVSSGIETRWLWFRDGAFWERSNGGESVMVGGVIAWLPIPPFTP